MIAVGDSGSVELIFHANAGQTGPVAKSATVTCTDTSRANFQLRLKANIYDNTKPDSLKPVVLSASSLKWLPTEKDKEQKLIVKNVSAAPVKFSLVSQPYGFASIDLSRDELKPGKTKEIKVKVAKEFSGTEFQKSFTIELTDSAKTRITVPVVMAAVIATTPAPDTKSGPRPKVPYVDTTKAAPKTKPDGKK